MNKEPLVSVVMPVYNTEKYLAEAIKSVLNQTYKNFEFIIIDDGSTDKSWEIIQKYTKVDRRIKSAKNSSNKGVSYSRNRAVGMSKGDYIALMDSDDSCDKLRIEKQLFFIRRENLDLCATNILLMDEKSRVISKKEYPSDIRSIRRNFVYGLPIAHPTILAKSPIFKKYKYDEKCKCLVEDYEWFSRILNYTKKIAVFPEPLYFYRINHKKINWATYRSLMRWRMFAIFKALFIYKILPVWQVSWLLFNLLSYFFPISVKKIIFTKNRI